jgi:hypothetical protein
MSSNINRANELEQKQKAIQYKKKGDIIKMHDEQINKGLRAIKR